MKHHHQGFTLLEIMIACGLSFLIVSMLISIYLGVKQNYQLQCDVMALQEDEIFITQYLISKIHGAHKITGRNASGHDCFSLDGSSYYIANNQHAYGMALYERQQGKKRSVALIDHILDMKIIATVLRNKKIYQQPLSESAINHIIGLQIDLSLASLDHKVARHIVFYSAKRAL